MEPNGRRVILLGPQRFRPVVVEALDALGCEGPIAVVTAGWQEREEEVAELQEHVGCPTVNLRLYQRAEEVMRRDPELAAALRARQDRLRAMQELYRLRLEHALQAARELMRRTEPLELIRDQRRSAIRAVRTLDGGHLRRIRAVHREFDAEWRVAEREAVAAQRHELSAVLDDCAALAVAGGHVAVLLNRLRLFDVAGLLGGKPVVAWSAGAMALGERVVLFHDSPPQGAGNAEVFEGGLGMYRRVLALPDAAKRLHLQDPLRVALLARRFAPAVPVALDAGSWVEVRGARFSARAGTRRLTARGGVVSLERG